MNPIQAAAEEICNELYMGKDWSQVEPHEVLAIIARHLWPVVKLEDVRGNGEYWVRIGTNWSTCHAMYIHAHHDQIDEIRGPIPMPEATQ